MAHTDPRDHSEHEFTRLAIREEILSPYFPVASKVQALCSYLLGSSVQRLTTGHSYSVIMLHSQCSGAAKLKATETSVKVLVLNCSRKM